MLKEAYKISYNLYSYPFRVIKSRIIKLAGGHVKPTGEGIGTFKVFVRKCEGKK
jgi:hypothetical protein